MAKSSFFGEIFTRTNERNYAQQTANNRKPAQTKSVLFTSHQLSEIDSDIIAIAFISVNSLIELLEIQMREKKLGYSMLSKLHSCKTLREGMEAVKFGPDQTSRKRELEELIKVTCIK